MESTEKAAMIDEEIKRVRVVPVAVRRIVVVVVAGGIRAGVAVRVAAPVAVGVALGVRIRGARMSVLVGAVGNILLRALTRSPHVEGRHVANDHLADSRISEPEEIVVAYFRRKLQAVRLGVGEDRYVRRPTLGQSDEILQERSRFPRQGSRVRISDEHAATGQEKGKGNGTLHGGLLTGKSRSSRQRWEASQPFMVGPCEIVRAEDPIRSLAEPALREISARSEKLCVPAYWFDAVGTPR
jgi:hypothetical protein